MKYFFLFTLLMAMLGIAIGHLPDRSVRPPFDIHDQLVDITGSHAFALPGNGSVRGPCPALNALANHRYISHDGVTNFDEARDAIVKVFALDAGVVEYILWQALAASGSADMWSLSIGGHHPRTDRNVTYPLKRRTHGLSSTHVGFESDASPTRSDLYDSQNPNAVDLDREAFTILYNRQGNVTDDEVDYNLQVVTDHRFNRTLYSIQNNTAMFLTPLNSVMGSATYLFIANLFANHSAAKPSGRLDRETLKSFYGVSGEPNGNVTWLTGAERIPANWYRRHSSVPLTVRDISEQTKYMYQQYPDLLNRYLVGGNANGTADNWVSVDVEKLSGGNFTLDSIKKGTNEPNCFMIASAPDFGSPFLEKLYEDAGPIKKLLDDKMAPLVQALKCPPAFSVDYTLFDEFKGWGNSLQLK